jgi:hypothetical protein
VRSWCRYKTRLFAYRSPPVLTGAEAEESQRLPLTGTRTVAYWSEQGCGRLQLLGIVILYLNESRWGRTIDSGWSDWDLEVSCHPWTVVQICTAQEDHGSDRYLIRVRYRLRSSGHLKTLAGLAVLGGVLGAGLHAWLTAAGTAALLAVCLGLWCRGAYRASQAVGVLDRWARELGMVRCLEDGQKTTARRDSPPRSEATDSGPQEVG